MEISRRPKQGWLFPWTNPLGQRIGREFFDELPESPGVYQMLNRNAEVIYVGQSACLRDRVNSYRYITSHHPERRLIRLVSQAVSIQIEICENPVAALELERILIRRFRPRFNRAHNQARAKGQLGASGMGGDFIIRWAKDASEADEWPEDGHCWGPVGRRFLTLSLQALRRQIWRVERPDWGPTDFPWGSFASLPPAEFQLPGAWGTSQMANVIVEFLGGTNAALLEAIPPDPIDEAAEIEIEAETWIGRDIELLTSFFEFQQRNSADDQIQSRESIPVFKTDATA